MQRPDLEQLDQIESILQDIEEAEHALKNLKSRLDDTVRNLGSAVSDRKKLIELATYLYWMIPEIKSAPLAEAVAGEPKIHLLKKILAPVTADMHCEKCKKILPFSSRNQLHTTIKDLKSKLDTEARFHLRSRYLTVCKECEKELSRERYAEYRYEQEANHKRLQELRTMPYNEYLQTPEWRTRRTRHLKSADYRCQVCNASNVELNVHHRTYKRRGEELYQDLLVLCKNCHGLFHREGRVVNN